MENHNKLVALWILTVIGMILHFNYHIGGIFYGIDVVRPDADGKETTGVFIIRTLFYHLPILWVIAVLYARSRWMKWTLFIISCLYAFAHASHLLGELRHETINPSQASLLAVVFIISAILVFEHFKILKTSRPKN